MKVSDSDCGRKRKDVNTLKISEVIFKISVIGVSPLRSHVPSDCNQILLLEVNRIVSRVEYLLTSIYCLSVDFYWGNLPVFPNFQLYSS